jgi:outer membrane protein
MRNRFFETIFSLGFLKMINRVATYIEKLVSAPRKRTPLILYVFLMMTLTFFPLFAAAEDKPVLPVPPIDSSIKICPVLQDLDQKDSQSLVVSARTLLDCYALALKKSETIAVNSELIREAEAHFLQSFGSLLPQLSYSWSNSRQDSSSVLSSFGQNDRTESKFVFKQTLFSGFKEFAGMQGSRLEKNQFAELKKNAELVLFVDVADAFYLLLQEREDLTALLSIREALVDRLAELKKRETIGRTRPSEVASTDAGLYNLEAEIESGKSRILIAEDLLAYLIGEPVGEIADTAETPNSLSEEVNFTARSDFRPDVKAAEYAWGVAKKEVTASKSDLFPEVSVEGNGYIHKNDPPSDQSWSTVFRVEVPIFEGTTTYGAIKAANSQARQVELFLEQTKRLALQDIRDSYIRSQAAILRFQSLEKALTAAELNYSLQKEDYQYSLVSNLEVLSALQNLADTRRKHIQGRYEKKRYYWQLRAAVGETILETNQ